MKFKFGEFKGKNDIGKFTTSMFDLSIDDSALNEDMTLKEVAEEIKDQLKMKNGEVELTIAFRYTMRAEEGAEE